MKRFLSILLVIAMLFGMRVNTFANEDGKTGETESSMERGDASEFAAYNPPDDMATHNPAEIPPYDFNETTTQGPEDITVCNPDVIIEDINESLSQCNHQETLKLNYNCTFEYYNLKRHIYTESYEKICVECGASIGKYQENSKEAHYLKNGECQYCGYIVKNCKHEEVYEKVVYWRAEEDDRGNDASFTICDVLCVNCGKKISEKTYYGPVVAVSENSRCDHNDRLKTDIEKECYEIATEESHYKIVESSIKCDKCEEVLKKFKTEEIEAHTLVANKCIKCGYEIEQTVLNEPISNFANDITKTTSNSTTKNGETKSKSNTAKASTSKNEESIDVNSINNMYIPPDSNNFFVNSTSVKWKSRPRISQDGNIQVPLRQMAEIMGWEVKWDEERKSAIVTKGKVTKIFTEGSGVYKVEREKNMVSYKSLENKVSLVDGILYVDLDGVLEGTDFSYYVYNSWYYIKDKQEVIRRIAYDHDVGKYNVTTSKTTLNEVNHALRVSSDEVLLKLTPVGDNYYYSIIVPAARQSLAGNYYKDSGTWEGLIGEIIVGELPFVGTAADFRDVFADFQNWEWSWAHAGQTTLDVVGIVPVIGALKYSDEVVTALKKGGKSLDPDAVKSAQKLLSKADSLDEVAEIAESTLKHVDEIADVSKKAIRNADDLKALVKNTDIYADDVLEHIFYGNKAGGLHYNGLSGANGRVVNITKAPNKYSVYGANVIIDGNTKYSTFFPDDWTPKQVLDAIDEAYHNGVKNSANQIEYTMKNGMKLTVNLNKSGKIISAYPNILE